MGTSDRLNNLLRPLRLDGPVSAGGWSLSLAESAYRRLFSIRSDEHLGALVNGFWPVAYRTRACSGQYFIIHLICDPRRQCFRMISDLPNNLWYLWLPENRTLRTSHGGVAQEHLHHRHRLLDRSTRYTGRDTAVYQISAVSIRRIPAVLWNANTCIQHFRKGEVLGGCR